MTAVLPEPAAPRLAGAAICDRVARLLLEKVGVAAPSSEADLMDSGLLDSLGLIDMLAALEEEFRIVIDLQEVDLERFRSVAAMAALVGEEIGRGAGARDPRGELVEVGAGAGRRSRP